MRVILYPRVSSKKQLEQGDSIEAQINRLKKFAEENNYEVVDIYVDGGKSASIKEDDLKQRINNNIFSNNFNLNTRPGFKKLLEEAPIKKFDAVVFYKWDRYSRDIAFAELSLRYFSRYKIKLIPSDDSDDPFVSSIMRAMGSAEIKKMGERVRNVRLNQFQRGLPVGRVPLGYKAIFKNKKNKRGIEKIIPDNKKAEMVRDIFERTAKSESYKKICADYKINPQTYYNILKNKVYVGIIQFEGQEKEGIHEPIISKELWEKVNK